MEQLANRRRYGKGFVLRDWFKISGNSSTRRALSLTIGQYVPTSVLRSISISRDGGHTWAKYNNADNRQINITIITSSSDEVFLKGDGSALATKIGNSSSYTTTFNANAGSTDICDFSVSGNIMSLLYGDLFEGKTSFAGDYAFSGLFYKCHIIGTINLPATTLRKGCYSQMFYYSSGSANIAATTIEESSCAYMCAQGAFSVSFPGSITIKDNGCSHMFYLSRIEDASKIVINSLSGGTYNCSNMFENATYLTKPPRITATTTTNYCYMGMFKNCTSLKTAPTLPATTLASNCYKEMFYNCTKLTTAPTLPARTLNTSCYNSMFYGCTNLSYIKALFTTTPGSYTSNWVYNVKSSGTFVKYTYATWNVTGVSGIPSGWTVQTASS